MKHLLTLGCNSLELAFWSSFLISIYVKSAVTRIVCGIELYPLTALSKVKWLGWLCPESPRPPAAAAWGPSSDSYWSSGAQWGCLWTCSQEGQSSSWSPPPLSGIFVNIISESHTQRRFQCFNNIIRNNNIRISSSLHTVQYCTHVMSVHSPSVFTAIPTDVPITQNCDGLWGNQSHMVKRDIFEIRVKIL